MEKQWPVSNTKMVEFIKTLRRIFGNINHLDHCKQSITLTYMSPEVQKKEAKYLSTPLQLFTFQLPQSIGFQAPYPSKAYS